eukprot:m.305855 g.305855  ORF g.305855 m.305855 type:complete len:623 (+) comp15912_c2_seq1:322-2190(+)
MQHHPTTAVTSYFQSTGSLDSLQLPSLSKPAGQLWQDSISNAECVAASPSDSHTTCSQHQLPKTLFMDTPTTCAANVVATAADMTLMSSLVDVDVFQTAAGFTAQHTAPFTQPQGFAVPQQQQQQQHSTHMQKQAQASEQYQQRMLRLQRQDSEDFPVSSVVDDGVVTPPYSPRMARSFKGKPSSAAVSATSSPVKPSHTLNSLALPDMSTQSHTHSHANTLPKQSSHASAHLPEHGHLHLVQAGPVPPPVAKPARKALAKPAVAPPSSTQVPTQTTPKLAPSTSGLIVTPLPPAPAAAPTPTPTSVLPKPPPLPKAPTPETPSPPPLRSTRVVHPVTPTRTQQDVEADLAKLLGSTAIDVQVLVNGDASGLSAGLQATSPSNSNSGEGDDLDSELDKLLARIAAPPPSSPISTPPSTSPVVPRKSSSPRAPSPMIKQPDTAAHPHAYSHLVHSTKDATVSTMVPPPPVVPSAFSHSAQQPTALQPGSCQVGTAATNEGSTMPLPLTPATPPKTQTFEAPPPVLAKVPPPFVPPAPQQQQPPSVQEVEPIAAPPSFDTSEIDALLASIGSPPSPPPTSPTTARSSKQASTQNGQADASEGEDADLEALLQSIAAPPPLEFDI